ncbi:lipase [Gregarina niphandrodes]|uniref:Lipase n=1 Tax=Gregarina niphandrodes TaxID=110365 RepID=A0A023B3X4_GRENI|nr:lipase [Gregarina niphandrodes]EZG56027.1 lipase [Gregarina niphandrodes]|eukprot:XP_011131368.1 lipase [Gregarina niphandrodes]
MNPTVVVVLCGILAAAKTYDQYTAVVPNGPLGWYTNEAGEEESTEMLNWLNMTEPSRYVSTGTTNATMVGATSSLRTFVHRLVASQVGRAVDCDVEPFTSFKVGLNLSDSYTKEAATSQLQAAGVSILLKKLATPTVETSLPSTSSIVDKVLSVYDHYKEQANSILSGNTSGSSSGDKGGTAADEAANMTGVDAAANGSASNIVSHSSLLPNVLPGGVDSDELYRNFVGMSLGGAGLDFPMEWVGFVRDALADVYNSYAASDGLRGSRRRQLASVSDMLSSASAFLNAMMHSGTDVETVTRFFSSHFVKSTINSVIGNTSIEVSLKNTSISIQSPMQNLGSALCEHSATTLQHDTTNGYQHICTMLGVARAAIACSADVSVNDCSAVPSHYERELACERYDQDPNKGFVLDLDVKHDFTYPATQGNMDRWLFNGINLLYQYARYDSACGTQASELEFLPGWDTVGELNLDYADTMTAPTRRYLPIAVILRSSKHKCHFATLIRGTQASFDWLIDFQTEMEDLTVRNVSLGRAHGGFKSLAMPVAYATSKVMKKLVEDLKCDQSDVKLTISGHSLGAGTAMVASLIASELLKGYDIAAVGFAAPMSLDMDAAKILVDRVTMRTWMNEYDGVPRIPCSTDKGMARCNKNDGKTDFFVPTPHAYEVSFDQMVKLMAALNISDFGSMTVEPLSGKMYLENIRSPAPLRFSQMHTCAYTCWLDSQYCHNQARARNICDLCSYYGL